MNTRCRVAILLMTLLLAGPGCHREASTASRLEELEKTFQVSAPEAPQPVPEVSTAPSADAPDAARSYVSRAIAAVKTDEPADAVMLLQSAQRLTTLSAEERMSIQRTIRAVTADLVERASRGDRKAQADLKAIEQFLAGR